MILIFGGTTEGRMAAKTLDEAGKEFFYSTKNDWQEVEMRNGKRLIGAMDTLQMSDFCKANGIECIVDAAHPFATILHTTIKVVSKDLDLPVVSVQRQFGDKIEGVTYCRDYDDAILNMKANGVRRLLALTGVNTIAKLKEYWTEHDTWFRILDKKESLQIATENGFPLSRTLFLKNTPSLEEEICTMRETSCDAILTKESGESGGMTTKVRAAKELDLKIFIVSRPEPDESFIKVFGPNGLRHAIEGLLPSFFPLRTGYTTGLCATGASKAATMALTSGNTSISFVNVTIPSGEYMPVPVQSVTLTNSYAEATVIKEAGDDPDVTNGCAITSHVEYDETPGNRESNNSIMFLRGKGVGVVTLPGLGLEVGEPAVNPTPRRMIENELRQLTERPLLVTLSIKDGEELAKKTFNPKVGVVGGLSIIGTSGIVKPFSHEAFIESIRREMNVAKAMGCNEIVVNSGAKSENFIRQLFPHLIPQAFIHYGNAIGETLDLAREVGFGRVSVGLMIGKAVKLAEGHLDTHSHKVTMNKDFLVSLASEAGCTQETTMCIEGIQLARELWSKLPQTDSERFLKHLLRACRETCTTIFPADKLNVFLVSETGKIVSL